MHVTETQIDDLTRQFHVTMPAADIERKVEARLGELAQTMRLPGFRPGKVPLGLMRKRFGDAVKSEVVEQAINESSQAVISERGLRAALPPKVELSAAPEQGDLEYTLAVELLPEITPPDFSQISLERLIATVDDAEIDRRIQRFAAAVGEETPAGRSAGGGWRRRGLRCAGSHRRSLAVPAPEPERRAPPHRQQRAAAGFRRAARGPVRRRADDGFRHGSRRRRSCRSWRERSEPTRLR